MKNPSRDRCGCMDCCPRLRTALRRMAYFGENTVERELPERAGEAAAFLATAQAAAWRGKILDLRPLD